MTAVKWFLCFPCWFYFLIVTIARAIHRDLGNFDHKAHWTKFCGNSKQANRERSNGNHNVVLQYCSDNNWWAKKVWRVKSFCLFYSAVGACFGERTWYLQWKFAQLKLNVFCWRTASTGARDTPLCLWIWRILQGWVKFRSKVKWINEWMWLWMFLVPCGFDYIVHLVAYSFVDVDLRKKRDGKLFVEALRSFGQSDKVCSKNDVAICVDNFKFICNGLKLLHCL